MKARLVKYSATRWRWEIYSRNGCVVCESWYTFGSKKAVSRSLDSFMDSVFSYSVPIEYSDIILDCTGNDEVDGK